MKISCDVVTDLLPLYHDGVCSQPTKKQIAEHLAECERCRSLLGKISNTTIDSRIKAERDDVIMHQAKALNMRVFQKIGAAVFTVLLFIGILTCVIVDLAVSGALTWSLIPISACVFAGFVLMPAIRYGVRGLVMSLIIFSVLVVPFLFVLSLIIDSDGLILAVGVRMSVIAIIYLWGIFAVFRGLWLRKFLALAVTLLLAIPFSLVVNSMLSRVIAASLFDVWDAMAFAIIVVVAAVFVYLDFFLKRRKIQ